MRPKLDPSLLQGRWLRAHEEEQPGQAVLRPATYPFPPARGRTGYEFHPGGRVTKLGIGPTDRSAVANGSWSIDPDGRLKIEIPGQQPEVLEVLAADHDRLVVKM